MTALQSVLLLRRHLIISPPDTLYEGGVFKAHLMFPKDYALRMSKMKFITWRH
uniref:UBC core domain-containing protein n=1 Tax=Anolis carolinensis TaxID=28377 RepID=A0A803SVV6_ANOCA